MNMWLGIPIAIWVICAILFYFISVVIARLTFEYIIENRDIIHFSKNKNKDDYSSYFTFIFFWMYAPGLNIVFIIIQLIAIEIDNLKLMKFK